MPALALRKLFEQPGDAYHDWNSALPGHVSQDAEIGAPFQSLEDLQDRFSKAWNIRETLRSDMIALQEEMDWLVYAAYGLADDESCRLPDTTWPEPLFREQRPFVLWQEAEGDFDKAVSLIPSDWPPERRALWTARLQVIRDNEHIRRIEAPVYKRRWDEQWKVGNRWQCGPIAYDAELVDAFNWWLSEKAEWWLEHEAKGGPTSLDTWIKALSVDERIKAAWGMVSQALERLNRRATFEKYAAKLIKDQSVPADIPWAVPWAELEKKAKVPAAVKRIRGKLNVPRERFRTTETGQFIWAGEKS